MVHSKVFECFQEHLPAFAEKVETYFPNGKNSIRVRQKDGKEFIFSFNGEKTWRFETIDQFLAGMKGGKVHGRITENFRVLHEERAAIFRSR